MTEHDRISQLMPHICLLINYLFDRKKEQYNVMNGCRPVKVRAEVNKNVTLKIVN